MKLVDILAAELSEWPKGVDELEQDNDCGVMKLKSHKNLTLLSSLADDWEIATVTRAEWQAAVDALSAPKVVGWDGVGFPPVGKSVCEYLGAHQFDKWTVVSIFAHYGHTVFVDYGDGWRAETDSSRFRKIRTAEQVAAEEREKAIDEMVYGACGCEPDGGNTTAFMICGFIYDAGYRKEPNPCGS